MPGESSGRPANKPGDRNPPGENPPGDGNGEFKSPPKWNLKLVSGSGNGFNPVQKLNPPPSESTGSVFTAFTVSLSELLFGVDVSNSKLESGPRGEFDCFVADARPSRGTAVAVSSSELDGDPQFNPSEPEPVDNRTAIPQSVYKYQTSFQVSTKYQKATTV